MNDATSYASPEYPVLYTVGDHPEENGMIPVSLALLVGGIPSFLGTVPVEAPLLEGLITSLDAGPVRVVVEGIRIGEEEALGEAAGGADAGDAGGGDAGSADTRGPGAQEPPAWRSSIPEAPTLGGDAPGEEGGVEPHAGILGLPAALLSLSCTDGRRVGVARIVSRDPKADPTSVARFVHRQITRGVQIPDLASAG